MAWRRRRADKLELLRADECKDETEAPVLVVVVGGAPRVEAQLRCCRWSDVGGAR